MKENDFLSDEDEFFEDKKNYLDSDEVDFYEMDEFEDTESKRNIKKENEEIIWTSESKNELSMDLPYTHAVSVLDVAAYILKKVGPLSTMKLQKLVYYSQAWSLVWDEEVLFKEPIEAWAYGPVVRKLFNYHRGHFKIFSVSTGNPDALNEIQQETVDAVLDHYNDYSSQDLSDLTHMEDPWRMAREGASEYGREHKLIPLEHLAEYYGSLPPEN